MDVKSVFLQGKPTDRDAYLEPSNKALTRKVCKLNTTVYGLSGFKSMKFRC